MTVTINGSSGITAPEVILDNTTADGGQVVLKSSGYSNWNLDNYSGRLRAYYGASEKFTIDTSGNVGIGTSSPSAKLDIQTSGAATFNFQTSAANGGYGTWYAGSTPTYIGSLKAILATGNASDFAIVGTGANNLVLGTNSAERARIDSSGQMWTTNGAGSIAKAYDCRAWVNFNGTGTVAIRASGNVSSITDGGTGLYTVNFTTAMPDANYAVGGTAVSTFQGTTGSNGRVGLVSPNFNSTYSTTAVQVITKDSADANIDSSAVAIQIFR